MGRSCFAERLSHLLALTPGEETALARFEERPRSLKRGTVFQRENEAAGELFILTQGWAMSYRLLDDGARQIVRVPVPGDIIGFGALAFRTAPYSVVAVTDVTVCPFERRALASLFEEHPRMAVALFAISQADRIELADRLTANGRTSAKARVAAFLIDLIVRVRVLAPETGARLTLHLTQEELGDATGLTAVHVNRMLRVLADDGLIAREGAEIVIRDEPALTALAKFTARSDDFDLSWGPVARG